MHRSQSRAGERWWSRSVLAGSDRVSITDGNSGICRFGASRSGRTATAPRCPTLSCKGSEWAGTGKAGRWARVTYFTRWLFAAVPSSACPAFAGRV